MAISARIDELKKKFDENPRRYFAPLANEYRKAGDLEQAISICRAYLPQQPGHISGHIVFGQALFESGQLTESRGVFETALGLDPENLIALRHLGDIAREEGDIATARGWYQRVLDADPRNEEMAALLQSLAAVEVAAPTPPTGTQLNGEAADAATSWRDVNPETAKAQQPTPVAPPAPAPRAATATTVAPPRAATAPPAPASRAPTAPPVPAPRASTATPRAPTPPPPQAPETSIESLDFENSGDESAMPRAGTSASADGVERSSEVDFDSTRTAAPAPAAAAAPTPALPTGDELGLEVMEFVPPADGNRRTPVSGLDTSGAMYSGNVEVGGRDAAPPDAFVTETMAELYLQQGFEQEALAVYRELLARSPNDAALRERVDQLSRGARSSLSVAAISDAVIESAQRRQAARPTRTVRSFLGRMAARRVARRTGDAAPGSDAASEPEPEARDSWPRPQRRDSGRADAAEGGSRRGGDVEPPRGQAPDVGELSFRADSRHSARAGQGGSNSAAKASNGADRLFPEAAVRPEEDAAAALLARAYGEGLTITPASVTGKPARAASTELSLDNVFREVDRKAAPARQAGSYSFDQFFAEAPTSAPPNRARAGNTDEDEQVGGPSPDDIEQFNSWLQGLKKK
jgi:tetratricopeptide (TPR) repeat protein